MPDRFAELFQVAPAAGLAFLGQALRLFLARQRPHWRRMLALLAAAPALGVLAEAVGRQAGFAQWAITAAIFVLGAVVQEFFQTLESLSGRVARDPVRAVADIVGAVRGQPAMIKEDDHASQRIRPQSPDAF